MIYYNLEEETKNRRANITHTIYQKQIDWRRNKKSITLLEDTRNTKSQTLCI